MDGLPSHDFAAARFVVSFGADFLETWLSPVEYHRGFARMAGVDDHGSNEIELYDLDADIGEPKSPVQPLVSAALILETEQLGGELSA